MRAAAAHRVHDRAVGGGDHDRPALRLGGHQLADDVVGQHPGVAEQHPQPPGTAGGRGATPAPSNTSVISTPVLAASAASWPASLARWSASGSSG